MPKSGNRFVLDKQIDVVEVVLYTFIYQSFVSFFVGLSPRGHLLASRDPFVFVLFLALLFFFVLLFAAS